MQLPLEPQLRRSVLGARREVTKRAFDLCVAVILLPVIFPATLILMGFAKISTGSGLFVQTRIGRYGEPFQLYKICSMRPDADVITHVTTGHDPRITRFGRIIRKTKLDEFPQLWNVLKGEMSFVGPRPDMPEMFDSLPDSDAAVLCLRPGITGPASIAFSDEEERLAMVENPEQYNRDVIFPEKIATNHAYIREQSILGDCRIMLSTVFRVAR